jgi:hypothetical protein
MAPQWLEVEVHDSLAFDALLIQPSRCPVPHSHAKPSATQARQFNFPFYSVILTMTQIAHVENG